MKTSKKEAVFNTLAEFERKYFPDKCKEKEDERTTKYPKVFAKKATKRIFIDIKQNFGLF